MTEPREPGAEIVEWGTERAGGGGPLGWLTRPGRRYPQVAWLLAGLGGLALFGSLVDTWQVTEIPPDLTNGQVDEISAQLPGVGAWGTGWLVGSIAVGACLGLAVSGRPGLRATARSVGLAMVGAQLVVLVAASIHLSRSSVLDNLFGLAFARDAELEVQLGRGIYAGFLGLALAGAALWLTHPGTGAAVPAAPAAARPPDGPADLAVGPAEPFSYQGEDRTWR